VCSCCNRAKPTIIDEIEARNAGFSDNYVYSIGREKVLQDMYSLYPEVLNPDKILECTVKDKEDALVSIDRDDQTLLNRPDVDILWREEE